MFQPDDEITITYQELEDIMANKALDLTKAFAKRGGEKLRKAVFDITAMYAAEITTALYKRQEAEDGKV